uniref:Enoyl-CoA hydratase domain-containing protein 3, mitochondrial n=1 Tax=Phlebotomus papatasi TaxID=29031 RepID=A0A1B0D4Y3_PHLPP
MFRIFATNLRQFSSSARSKLTLCSEKDGVRNIVLNNPKTRNSLSLEMMNDILGDLTHNLEDKSLRVIVLSSVESPVFSAGHNLKELVGKLPYLFFFFCNVDQKFQAAEKGEEVHREVFNVANKLMMAMIEAPVPVIGKVNGLAAAAGCQLIANCDMVICSSKSSFSTPGATFGVFCSTPGVAVARKVSRMKAAQMLFTGLPISAQEALSCGLVSSVVPPEELDAEVDRICQAISSKSRSVIALGKKFFHQQVEMGTKEAFEAAGEVMVRNLSEPDGQEGVRSFVEKRKPIWTHKD